jgi:formylglycine-generating enzyme required for sulfatase activity
VGIESANYTSPGRVAVGDPAFTSGQTPEGIAHLLGNVSEWTSTPTDCAAYACDREWDGARPVLSLVTRGLSYKGHLSADQEGPDAHAVLGEFGNPGAFIASEDVGFRCAGG